MVGKQIAESGLNDRQSSYRARAVNSHTMLLLFCC